MEIVIVGSGTASPHPDRVGSAVYVAAAGRRLLLDCGPGAVHHLARFRLPWDRLTHLVLSHFHTDHIADVPTLLFALKHAGGDRGGGALDVLGPPGTRTLVELLAAAYGAFVADPGFPVHVAELRSGDRSELAPGLAIAVRRTPHTDASHAVRLETSQVSLVYTGDTGPDPALAEFARGADVLITECSLADEAAIETHLSPSSVAAFARAAAPRQLVLTHIYPHLERQDVPALVRAAGWDGTLRLAHDGLRIAL